MSEKLKTLFFIVLSLQFAIHNNVIMENEPTSDNTLHDTLQPSTSISPISRTSIKPRKIERSCLLCHQRKIRCNKQSPCSNCVRADVLCCYPGPQTTERRPHKTTIAEVSARVARLERTIAAISNSASSAEPINTNTQLILPSENAKQEERSFETDSSSLVDEVLIQHGSTSHYFNETLLSRILTQASLQLLELFSEAFHHHPLYAPS